VLPTPTRIAKGAAVALLAAGTVVAGLGLAAPAVGSTPAFQGKKATATVIKVIDGDTIKVRTGSRVYRIQLFAVEAPDAGTCFNEESTARLRRLLPPGSTVRFVVSPGTDDAGRFLADRLTRNGERIDIAMARGGYAQMYESIDQEEEMAMAAGQAQSQRRGLFGACTEFPLGDQN